MALAVSFETRIGEKRGTSSICIPYATMQPVLEHLASQQLFQSGGSHDLLDWTGSLERAVSEVHVELSVSFDHVALTSADIVGLQVGDIVPLNHAVTKPVTVSVDGVECYDAVTGRRGKRLACVIVGPHEEHTTT
jgi:flagellar motor switch protein FliM